VALGFIIAGTLVDLFPEFLLITDVIMHPRIFCDRAAAWKVAKLLCSDGKPIITFAASKDEVPEALGVVRNSIRKRLCMFCECRVSEDIKSVDSETRSNGYTAFLGCLAAGEVLTTVGGALLLWIDFGWPALVSVISSILAFLFSTRYNMMEVGRGAAEARHDIYRRFFENLTPADFIPGPISFLKLVVVGVPVWPLSLVVWGVYNRDTSSNDFLWVWPTSWLGVSQPSVKRVLDWILFPHYIMTWIGGLVAGLLVLALGFSLLFLMGKAVVAMWDMYWSEEEGFFDRFRMPSSSMRNTMEVLHPLLEFALGSGMSFILWFDWPHGVVASIGIVEVILLAVAVGVGDCAEQEWTFAAIQISWVLVLWFFSYWLDYNPYKPRPKALDTPSSRRVGTDSIT